MSPSKLVEYIVQHTPSIEIKGRTYFIVERDQLVDEDQLLKYAERVTGVASGKAQEPSRCERLVAATVDGKMTRWKPGTELTWSFDEESFKGHDDWRDQAEKMCTQAADDWNKAAEEQEIREKIGFSRVAKDPVFHFAYKELGASLAAVAFYPSDPPDMRSVYISSVSFRANLPYDKPGIVRHELGHVLGFRHEHIREEAQEGMTPAAKQKMEQRMSAWVKGSIGAEDLTVYDKQSVMHYPLNGHGTMTFEFSDLDKKGFGVLYKESDPAKIKECEV